MPAFGPYRTGARSLSRGEVLDGLLTGDAAIQIVQGLMGVLVILSLVYKRHRESPKRPWRIWFVFYLQLAKQPR